ncbi:hypothetical protein ATSB10_20700 [Dyella thiooxydans]|uniref:Uncharacterized protein n=1 Tax=Dyella thiooxydans TaxID=445710 RepID=A0A160N1X6_9GAMM|nr:hypothetical protein [Dyella thiooxydans]AND69524.1 hypothetical protein ATSB10_20700 [Dyella thiooxydans]
MANNPHILDAEQLKALSGKKAAAALHRRTSAQGIRLLDGAGGPWTAVEAVNAALSVSSASNDRAYSPGIL